MGIISSNNKTIAEILVNVKLNKLKDSGQIIKRNVEFIEQILNKLDETKENHKYISLSCIYGAFLGDSIGSACEFLKASNQNYKKIFTSGNIFKPGEITDDSEMALSAAFAYIDSLNNDPSRIQDYLYFYFSVWRYSRPKDIGKATSTALSSWEGDDIKDIKFDPQEVTKSNWNTLANGALMRISTFIVFYYYSNLGKLYTIIPNYFSQNNNNDNTNDSKDVDLNEEICDLYLDIYKELFKNVQITHPNPENSIACSIFTLMVLVGMITKDAVKVYTIFEQISSSKKFLEIHNKDLINYANGCQKKYTKIISDFKTKLEMSPVYERMGYYMHAFKYTIYFLYKYPDMAKNNEKDLYYKIMCEICNSGGDTDTNCAIVGQMIGPLIGYKNFKKDLFSTFIKYLPSRRTQFNSAFAYIYVNYLEQKILNKGSITPKEKEKEKKEEGFNYTAYNMIFEFLNNNYGSQSNKILDK